VADISEKISAGNWVEAAGIASQHGLSQSYTACPSSKGLLTLTLAAGCGV